MKCENNECRYAFFKKEESYYWCPYCGEIVKDNFPKHQYLREKILDKNVEFRTFIKYRNRGLIIFLHFMVIICGVAIFYRGMYLTPSESSYQTHAGNMLVKYGFYYHIIIFILCNPSLLKLKMIRAIIHNYAWYLNTTFAKMTKILLYVLLIFVTNQYIIPYYSTHFFRKFKELNMHMEPIDFTVQLYTFLFYMVLVFCFVSDICELYRKNLCKNVLKDWYYKKT